MSNRRVIYDIAALKRMQDAILAAPRRRLVAAVHWFAEDQAALFVWKRERTEVYDMEHPLLCLDQFGELDVYDAPLPLISPALAVITQ